MLPLVLLVCPHSSCSRSLSGPNFIRYGSYSQHVTVEGQRGCIRGQGELKKVKFDPLFSLNHTMAMLRANVSRLIRQTWCTTKKAERLSDHLALYAYFHNTVLT
jgi:hypothetical protein